MNFVPDDSTNKKRRINGIETSRRVLDIATQELETHGPANFNLDRVLATSGVSRGSVYHHFGNRDGLIMAVELHRLQRNLQANDLALREVLAQVSTPEEAYAILEAGLAVAASEQQRATRLDRFASFAASKHAPAIRLGLRELQQKAEREFSITLRMAKDKGFIDPVEPIEGTANFIQGFLLGRMVVDVLDSPESDQQWHVIAATVLKSLLRPQI
ncbi:MAG: hypothetical protein RIR69_1774 [Actinomycetota bacterium]